jgi:hypothetical protein
MCPLGYPFTEDFPSQFATLSTSSSVGAEKVRDFDAQRLRDLVKFQDGDIPTPVFKTVVVGPMPALAAKRS